MATRLGSEVLNQTRAGNYSATLESDRSLQQSAGFVIFEKALSGILERRVV